MQFSQESELDQETLEMLWLADHSVQRGEPKTKLRLKVSEYLFADPARNWRLPYRKDPAPVSVLQRGRCDKPLAEFLVRVLCALCRAVPAIGELGDAVVLRCIGLEVVGRLHPLSANLTWEKILSPDSQVLRDVASGALGGAERIGRRKFFAWHGAVRELDDYAFVPALARAYNDAVPLLLKIGERLVLDEIVIERKAITQNFSRKPSQKGIEFICVATPVHSSGGSAT